MRNGAGKCPCWTICTNSPRAEARIAGSSYPRFRIIYIKALQESGTRLPETYCKHLDGEIWELRPIRDRILFAAWMGDSFVLLHSFMKQTQKTPKRELDQARRELDDFKERWSE